MELLDSIQECCGIFVDFSFELLVNKKLFKFSWFLTRFKNSEFKAFEKKSRSKTGRKKSEKIASTLGRYKFTQC